MKFVGLHAHSLSIGDSIGYPEDHFKFVVENAGDESMALAITDHGTAIGFGYMLQAYQNLKKKGINFKPIWGVEAYFHPDLEQWFLDKEASKEKKDDENDLVVENESESKDKNKWYNPINRRHHLVIIAQNKVGLRNLNALISESYMHGFYRFPRIDTKMLEKYNEGLIISTACLGGFPSWLILRDKDKGEEVVMNSLRSELLPLMNIFGDRAFLELQFNKIPEQKLVNEYLVKLSNESGYQLIATADSHYARPEWWKERELYKMLAMQSKGYDIDKKQLAQSIDELKCELFPKNGDQMFAAYKLYNPELDEGLVRGAIERTWTIAHERCELIMPDGSFKLPVITPKEITPDEDLCIMARAALNKRCGHFSIEDYTKYSNRLETELNVIIKKGYSNYFLILKKALGEIQKEYITGCGRGSGAGSLVCYLLGITKLDPIKHNLLFERFLSENRNEAPDIDNDVEDRNGALVVLRKIFGEDSIVAISNFNTLQLKSLIKDLAKVEGIPFAEVNEVTSKMEFEARPKILDEIGHDQKLYVFNYDGAYKHSPTFRNFIDKYPAISDHVKILFKQLRVISKHAGGVAIVDNSKFNMPLIKIRGELQTPWTEGLTAKHLEQFGIIKYDFLGLATLRTIRNAIERILRKLNQNPSFENVIEFYDKNLHPDVIGQGEKQVFTEIYHLGKWLNVFQFTEKKAQEFCKAAQPVSIDDISAITAIFRPGPLCLGKNTSILIKSETWGGKRTNITSTIKELYDRWINQRQNLSPNRNNPIYIVSKSEYGMIDNQVKSVHFSGKKPVYKILFQEKWKNGKQNSSRGPFKCIESTNEHQFLTLSGYKQLKDIQYGEYILRLKPAVVVKKRTNKHPSNIEGTKNYQNIAFQHYQYKCIFCDWSESSLDVNHLDGNRYTNNSSCNLSILCPNHHRKFTDGLLKKEEIVKARELVNLPNEQYFQWVRYLGKEFIGYEDTYDIEMESPYNNFIAGGFVVHNSGGGDKAWVQAVHGGKVSFEHPILEEILGSTRGILVYQEQFMLLANKLAGFSLTESDELRKLLVKPVQSLGDQMKQKRIEAGEKFIQGCIDNGLSEQRAKRLWNDEIMGFISYGFNKSHSDCYAYISYQCAWLLFYYPSEWIAAVLETETAASADEKASIISNVRSFGYTINFPDINVSKDTWEVVDDKTFQAPFTLVKGVGEKALLNLKENAPYASIEDVIFNANIDYRQVNKKVLAALCLSGAFSSLMDSRFENDRHLYACLVPDKKPTSKKKFAELIENTRGKYEPLSKKEIFSNRLELLGFLDLDLLMSSDVKRTLLNKNINSISTFEFGFDQFCWFYIESFEKKTSKSKNDYLLLKVIGSNLDAFEIFLFGYDEDKKGPLESGVCCVAEIAKNIGPSRFSVYNGQVKLLR